MLHAAFETQDPPVDLRNFSRECHVRRLIQKPIAESAMVFPSKDGYLIAVNQNHAEVRKRFSWAHELGHIFLGKPLGHAMEFRGKAAAFKKIERACDQIAAEILMPIALFKSYLDVEGWSLDSLPPIAKAFRVSLSSAAIRYTDLLSDPCVLLLWRVKQTTSAIQIDQEWQRSNQHAMKFKYLSTVEGSTYHKALGSAVRAVRDAHFIPEKEALQVSTATYPPNVCTIECFTESVPLYGKKPTKCLSAIYLNGQYDSLGSDRSRSE